MPLFVLLGAFNILLVVHAAKTGRFNPWGYVILSLPVAGGLAYLLVEVLPDWVRTPQGLRARRELAAAVNPDGAYRRARDEFLIAETPATRLALARAAMATGRFQEALDHFERLIEGPLGDEPFYHVGKAEAELALDQPARAVATLEAMRARWPGGSDAEAHLLYARALEAAGRAGEALHEYADVSNYYPGPEPAVRRAELLLARRETAQARDEASKIAAAIARAPAHVRRKQAEWARRARHVAAARA